MWLRAICLCAAAVAVVPPVVGQALPTPGRVTEPFRRPPELPPSPEPQIERPKEERPVAPPSDQRILVKRFTITGNEELGSEELLSRIADLQGQELTLQEIYEASNILTDYYRSKGYLLARVVVPAQRVTLGVIELKAIEGRVYGVRFEGNETYEDAFLGAHVGDTLKQGVVLTSQELERELLLLNDMPGLSARAVLKPGPDFGTTDLNILVEEKPYDIDLSLNNFGREEVGQWRVDGEVDFNNFSGSGDRMQITFTQSQDSLLTYLGLGYDRPINTRGTRLGLFGSYITYDVDDNDEADWSLLGIDGENYYWRADITHPIKRSRRENLFVIGGVSYNDTESESCPGGTGCVTTLDQYVYLLELGVMGNYVHDDQSQTNFWAQFSTNFKDNDVDPVSYEPENNAQLAKLEFDVSHLRRITRFWDLFASVHGVLSADPLMDSEKFAIGGVYSMRGYPSAEVRGDYGAEITIEGRRRLTLWNDMPAVVRIFGDAGKVWRKDPPPFLDDDQHLSDIGVGIDINPTPYLSLHAVYAKPTTNFDSSDGEDSDRWWFEVRTRF